jgi:hypothetical protein
MALSERRSTISASRALPTTSFGGADAVAESGDLLGGGLIDVSKAVVKREAEAAVSGALEARLALSSLSLLRAPAILSALRCAHAPPVRHPRHATPSQLVGIQYQEKFPRGKPRRRRRRFASCAGIYFTGIPCAASMSNNQFFLSSNQSRRDTASSVSAETANGILSSMIKPGACTAHVLIRYLALEAAVGL